MASLKRLPVADSNDDLNLRILKLENRLQRERLARLEAEAIAETGTRQLYERQRQLELLETVATCANESRSVEETLRFVQQAICAHTNWVFANVFLVDQNDARCLIPTTIWHAADPARVTEFVEESLVAGFEFGRGLPGRVLEARKPVSIPDLATDEKFRRRAAAEHCGLRSAFAFPVLAGNEVLAVIEFFHWDRIHLDESFLTVMTQIGTQLGRVMERQRSEQRLIHDATHDALTGLPNRLLFTDRLEHAVMMRRRNSEFLFAVLFIDLDRFKLVNDSLGHAAGDVLLKETAIRLSAALGSAAAELDAVATLSRLGGDEFTVLIEQITHESAAIKIAEQMLDVLKQPVIVEEQELFISASIGVALCGDDQTSAADIMRDSDLALYRAKAEGRSRVEVFDTCLLASARKRLALESDLRRALVRKEFELHYQPIVALDGNDLVGFEALVRWRRADDLLLPPSEFIAVAEETGLIIFLGQWVIREALSTLARWQKASSRTSPLTMSINVSPRQFQQPDFVDHVMASIQESGVAPHAVRLELTESVTIVDVERTLLILQRLRDFGVRMSIDDFGTGYSSLSYLHRLPFDTLKIDRSFVSALQGKTEGYELVQTILDMARNLNMDVVAEGAETEAHVDQLRLLGCEYAQGFFFSRPLHEAAASLLITDGLKSCDRLL